jgi:hypothetical protein
MGTVTGEGTAPTREMLHPCAEGRVLKVDGQRYAGLGESDRVLLEAALAISPWVGVVVPA